MKSIKIHFVEGGLVINTTRQMTSLFHQSVEFVSTAHEADLVVAESLRDIEAVYTPDKHYVIVSDGSSSKTETPKNVTVYPLDFKLPSYCALIEKVRANLKDKKSNEEMPLEMALLSDAKQILVIDDTPANLVSAKKCLAGHHLTVASGYEMAMTLLAKEKFDVVLTDLYMPMSSRTLSEETFKLGRLVPYGFILMIEAARCGAKFVAVVTDLNHHDDHFSAAFDHFEKFSLTIEGAKVRMLHAHVENGVKDWLHAMEALFQQN